MIESELRAELAKVTAERDALKIELVHIIKALAEVTELLDTKWDLDNTPSKRPGSGWT